ncbi:MAG: hypothetical protein EHM33_04275 [Chloroflexi bacterium]|nr:MAG: hypothetical protein EHM33_04275 [Chloroflexota bacterium]
MKYKSVLIASPIILLFFLSACTASDAQIATAIAQTEAAKPTSTPEPTATQTPEPTQTLTPTIQPTPTIELSGVVQKTYSNIDVIYRDEFDNVLSGFSPAGWTADGEKLYATSDASLEINGQNTVAFFDGKTISVNEAVIVRFKFAPKSNFTIGIDGVRQGQRIPAFQPGFRSVSMEFRNSPSAFFNSEQNRYYSRFEGELKLLPDVWYMYTLGFAQGKQFVIKIWDPENPQKVLIHRKQVDDMTNVNIFIMWVDQNAELYIDDFTIIKFSDFLD